MAVAKRKSSGKAGRASPSRAAKARDGEGQARRPYWAGQLRLALVSVPVKIYAATKSGARLSFHQIDQKSGKRIRYEKVVPGQGPVEAEDIVKGYEFAKGKYVILTDEEIDSAKIEAKRTLELVQFVDAAEIDPIWYERPYYVVPDGELAEEAYNVLRDALRATRKVGIGQFVLRGREYVASIKPCGQGLLLETLRFADEIQESAPFFAEIGGGKASDELLELAEELIRRKTKKFDPERFSDHYTEALQDLIAAKRKHQPIPAEDDDERDRGKGVVDLVAALKNSVAANDEAPAKPSRRKAG